MSRSISRAELNERGRAFILCLTLDSVVFVREDGKMNTIHRRKYIFVIEFDR